MNTTQVDHYQQDFEKFFHIVLNLVQLDIKDYAALLIMGIRHIIMIIPVLFVVERLYRFDSHCLD